MKSPAQMSRTAILVEGALMVALAFALSSIPFFEMPTGGSVTLFSTLPIIIMSFRHSFKWGLGTAAVYGFTQMLHGLKSVALAKTFGAMILCILLDYLLAYTLLGLSGPIARKFKNKTLGLVAGISITGLLRLFCSFLSGILIWGGWAPEGTPVWLYSLTYNASWSIPDVSIVLIATLLLSRVQQLHILPEPQNNTIELRQ